MTLVEEVVCLCHIISRGRWMKKITVMEIEGKLSYCFSARLRNVTAAKRPDCRMALLQYGLTAICLYCNMATAIWHTAIWRRQNDALPENTHTRRRRKCVWETRGGGCILFRSENRVGKGRKWQKKCVFRRPRASAGNSFLYFRDRLFALVHPSFSHKCVKIPPHFLGVLKAATFFPGTLSAVYLFESGTKRKILFSHFLVRKVGNSLCGVSWPKHKLASTERKGENTSGDWTSIRQK